MSIQQRNPGTLLASYPEFGLSWRYDDEDDPAEVTVFEGGEIGRTTTEWLTADVDAVVSIDEVQ